MGRPSSFVGPLVGVCSIVGRTLLPVRRVPSLPKDDDPCAFLAESDIRETLDGGTSSITVVADAGIRLEKRRSSAEMS